MLNRVEHIFDEAGRCSWAGLSDVERQVLSDQDGQRELKLVRKPFGKFLFDSVVRDTLTLIQFT